MRQASKILVLLCFPSLTFPQGLKLYNVREVTIITEKYSIPIPLLIKKFERIYNINDEYLFKPAKYKDKNIRHIRSKLLGVFFYFDNPFLRKQVYLSADKLNRTIYVQASKVKNDKKNIITK